MKRNSFRAKLTVTLIAFTVAILLATTLLTYKAALNRQKAELQGKILGYAKLAAQLIDTEKLIGIPAELSSQGTSEYRQIKSVLDGIRNIDPLIDSVYTMIKSDKEGIWVFLVDSGDKKNSSAYCGERYDVSGMPEMEAAFLGPAVDRDFTVDKWGIFLSGYAPLYDAKDNAAAIVGIDVLAGSVRQMQITLAKSFILSLILGILFSLFLGWFIARSLSRPLKELALGVAEVTEGDLNSKVNIKTGDELEELARDFNIMTDRLAQSRQKLQEYYLETIHSFARAIEAKDPYTKGHSERVMEYAVGLAGKLGFSREDLSLLEESCMLHDIGKIGIPEDILTKPGPLTDSEWKIVKTHPEIGEDILKFFEFLQPGLSIVRGHHERPDGKGYPDGLSAGQISDMVGIVSIADAFDAMTSDRSYRKAFSQAEAIKILVENKGKQFDARLVDSFVDYLTGK